MIQVMRQLITEIERVTAQRDRAWRTLIHVEAALTPQTYQLAFILADGHGRADAVEWNAVVEAVEARETESTKATQ